MIAQLNSVDEIELSESYLYKDYIKATFQGCKWNKDRKVWTIPFSVDNVEKLIQETKCIIPEEILDEYRKQQKKLEWVTKEKLLKSSVAMEPMPVKVKPYIHQVKAFNIACRIMNLFKKE